MDNEVIINRGDTKVISATFTQDSSAYDLTDHTVYLTIKKAPTPDNDDSDAVLQKTITDGGASGVASFSLSASETRQLSEGKYFYNIRLCSQNNGTVLSTQNGILKVRLGVTQKIISN